MPSNMFLRRVLGLDALSCAALGLLLASFASSLAPLFGLPEGLLRAAGLLLLPLALFIGWLSSRAAPPRALVWVVIVGNLGWTAESFAILGQFGHSVSGVGTAFVATQALAVLVLACLEYAGLRRSAAAI